MQFDAPRVEPIADLGRVGRGSIGQRVKSKASPGAVALDAAIVYSDSNENGTA